MDLVYFDAPLYGLLILVNLFTPRQLLSLMTFVKWVRLAHEEIRGSELGVGSWGVEEREEEEIRDSELGVGSWGEEEREEEEIRGSELGSWGEEEREEEEIRGSELGVGSWGEEEREEFAKAICTYLGILCDRLADYNSSITHWHNTGEKMSNTFARQALPMVWDFAEINPLGNASGNARRCIGMDFKIY